MGGIAEGAYHRGRTAERVASPKARTMGGTPPSGGIAEGATSERRRGDALGEKNGSQGDPF